jgi:hypothetical protein
MRMSALGVAMLLSSTVVAGLPTQMPVYPNTVQIQIGDDLIIGGEYFRIASFSTPDSVTDVAEYFFQKWKRIGFPTMVDGHPEEEMIVSAFYTREGIQRSVVLKQRAGKTIGFSTLRDLWSSARPSAPAEMLSPAEGVVWLQNVESREGSARMQHRTALIELKLASLAEDTKKQLAAAGYALAHEITLLRDSFRHQRLEHTRGERRVVTHLAEVEAGVTAFLQTCVGCDSLPTAPERVRSPAAGGGND